MRAPRSALPALILTALFGAGIAPAAGGSGDAPRLDWLLSDGSVTWELALTPRSGLDETPRALLAPPWFPPLPQLELELIEGGQRALDDFEGKLLILSFWAIWCEPCAVELPWLQKLYLDERENGLDVLTVNVNDPDDAALQFAWALNLVLPIARYGKHLDDAFEVRALPTVILIDRNGRVRGRWSGHRPEDEPKIADRVRTLLDEDAGPPAEQIAEVLSGHGRLAVRWSRRLPASPAGLARLPGGGGLLATVGRELMVLGPDGGTIERLRAPIGTGQLRTGALETEGSIAGIGFRRGATRVVPLVLGGGESVAWEAPAPVLDLEFGPSRKGAKPDLLLATTAGLHRVGLDGAPIDRREELGSLRAVAVTGSGQVVVLDSSGRTTWLDADLETLESRETSPSASVLVAAGGLAEGIGVAPAAVVAATAGRFLAEEGGQIALATEDHLVLLDAVSAEELFRARWPKISLLAAADLNGDGREELMVGSGKRITVLEARPSPQP